MGYDLVGLADQPLYNFVGNLNEIMKNKKVNYSLFPNYPSNFTYISKLRFIVTRTLNYSITPSCLLCNI
jgi:hypothetical protein